MKRLIRIFLLFAFTGILQGCTSIEFNIEDTIKPPAKENVIIQGTWKIEKYIPVTKGQDKNEQEAYLGKSAIFDNEISAIGKEVCINPEYKLIRTTAGTFIQNRYRIDKESLGLQKEDVNVITITTDNRLFYELIVTDQMTAYVYKGNGFLVLGKVSDTVDSEYKESSYKSPGINLNSDEYTEDPLLRSGVLIGIRSSENTYRTLWVYSKNRDIKSTANREQLVIPRAKGFWEIGAEKSSDGRETIYARPFMDISPKQNLMVEKTGAKILFAGNDYIGIEHNLQFSVFSIDSLSQQKTLALSDIISDAPNAIQKSGDVFLASLEEDKQKNIIKQTDEDNFTLKRRNGHWIMRSRFYYKEPEGDKKYEDFDLSLMVPAKLIHYDEMDIPWNEIKSKIPWITDGYMSPNKDIVILVADGSLNIYSVQNKKIVNKQLMKIPLSKGDSVVMTEWATGRYADLWQAFTDKSFAALK